MPINRNAYLRYLIIHREIKRNKYIAGYPSKTDLIYAVRKECTCSESTLEKDIGFLKSMGAPVVYNRDKLQMCYHYTGDWEFGMQLSPEDVRMFNMLIHKLELFGEAPEFRMLKDSIETLSNHFNLSQQHPGDRIDKYILFEYSKGFAGKQHLPLIYDSIYAKKEITFTHCRFEADQPTQRTICPYILKEHRNRWYVIGKENEEPRIFGLDRISDLKVLERHFIQDPDFYDEIFRILRDSVCVMAFGFESQDVVLHFSASEAKYVKSLMLHRSQQVVKEDDEGITLKLHVKVTREFIMECILRFGNSVRVLQPQSLADQVKDLHLKAFESYTKEEGNSVVIR